ncbi:hypothetical protein FSARC_5471 [Fusarium sarcochroum]|uniref:Uncharacterized protein n=1 Tax=Fusarium sarcochroum TaxID=1208366 RepID=A0A8H4TZK5_9HYPO|nr:hypothetical protein FSARC_5471 [Fusarium sarcochroum]
MALRIVTAVFAVSTTAYSSSTETFYPSIEVAAKRGPAIFNSVHDSLRKWGSTVHPNGMSFYLATIPEGVMLHHGNDRNETPTSFDWLAYEIEHAEIFARVWPPRRPDLLILGDGDQVSLADTDMEPMGSKHGWLHTYRTTRPLQLIYIDGMSGNKDDSGVRDTQDYLLRGVRDGGRAERLEDKPPGPPGEYERVQDLCHLCTEWKLDGIVRVENAGFEVIKCDFSTGMEQVQSLRRADWQRVRPPGHGPKKGGHKPNYRDIGPGRTILDYSSMVSAFFFPVNLTNPDSNHTDLPRLTSTTVEEMTAIRKYLTTVLEDRLDHPLAAFTWRDVADLIVQRYGVPILSVANSTDSEALSNSIRFLVEVFIDYSVDDEQLRSDQAQQRCSSFYIQTMPLATDADKLIYAAFEAVNAEICTALFKIRALLSADTQGSASLKEAKDILESLIEYLSWSDLQTRE